MIRVIPLAFLGILVLFGCSRAQSETGAGGWSQAMAEGGLDAALTSLQEQEQTPETAFLSGGVSFLAAVEHILQVRYRTYSGALPMVPGMRNELPPNPDARFDPAFVAEAMEGALGHLSAAEQALGPAIDGSFAAEVALDTIWFDINANETREDWEGLLALLAALNGAPDEDFEGIVRFDTADAEWLKAYVHVVSGMAELTLSLDPTPAIQHVSDGRAALEAVGNLQGLGFAGDDFVDVAAATLLSLRGVPDAGRTGTALTHFQAMIAHNKAFWAEIGEETDNDREWLPNPDQTSAFGVEIDADMAAAWQDVLDEIEAILNGERLVPYWRVGNATGGEENGAPVGLNIGAILQNPGDMDPVLWIQGSAAVPYLETGEIADMAAWRQFTQMTRGDSLLFAVLLN